ncbi:MAG TPA: hypothetical protein VF916_01885 [Ktedonobacterales bacterium]
MAVRRRVTIIKTRADAYRWALQWADDLEAALSRGSDIPRHTESRKQQDASDIWLCSKSPDGEHDTVTVPRALGGARLR